MQTLCLTDPDFICILVWTCKVEPPEPWSPGP